MVRSDLSLIRRINRSETIPKALPLEVYAINAIKDNMENIREKNDALDFSFCLSDLSFKVEMRFPNIMDSPVMIPPVAMQAIE